MPKVYVPQVPSKYDSATKLWVPSVNLDHAKTFGEVVVMLPPNANRMHIAPLVVALREQMKGYTTEDYIVAVGDPALISVAACLAERKAGFLRILKWDRQVGIYMVVEAHL